MLGRRKRQVATEFSKCPSWTVVCGGKSLILESSDFSAPTPKALCLPCRYSGEGHSL